MSVAAMTLDDQRPLMNNFDPIKKQYDHISNASSGAASVGGSVVTGPASGPASPTPSASEEQQQLQQQHHHHHHHHHHSGHHHHHQSYHQQHQQQQSPASAQQYQHQQHPQLQHDDASAIVVAEQRQRLLEGEIEILKLEQSRLSQQCAEAQRREKILMRRLANKEQEFQDYVSQIAEYKAAQAPGPSALRSALLDPAINLLFEKLKKELKATKAKLEETQNELSAWKFTPDSNTGKRLMAKCRLLYQENEELGKMTSNGRLAKLETELTMQKSFSEEVKKSQSELDDFLQELDEDVEGMQSTILFLQQELKTTRDRIQVLEKENAQLKNGDVSNENTTDFVDEEQTSQHIAINGNANNIGNDNNEMISHNLDNSKTMIAPALSAINTSANKGLKESIEIERIGESNTLHNNCNNVNNTSTTSSDFLNGNEEQAPKIGSTTDEDGASTNSNSSSNNICNKMSHNTAIATRKRNYEECEGVTDDNTEAPSTSPIIQVPRTLPPKKSKLRIVPARRASVQSVEATENESNAVLASSVNVTSTVDNMQQNIIVAPKGKIFGNESSAGENGRRFLVREEETKNCTGGGSTNGGITSGVNNTGSVSGPPQSIVTRRMSLRISSIGENIV